jgi:hypothetical protein
MFDSFLRRRYVPGVRLRETGVVCLVAAGVGGAAAANAYNVPPVQGKKAVTGPVSGKVTVRTSPNSPPVTVAPGGSIPNGSEVNATNGTVTLVVRQQGEAHKVSVAGGEFVFRQDPRTGRVVFTLALPLTGCPSTPSASRRRAVAAQSHKRRPRRRKITVSDSGGNFGTRGQFVATSTEGTRWQTSDTCGSSTVTVYRGRVIVTSLLTGRQITISAGQHYTIHK